MVAEIEEKSSACEEMSASFEFNIQNTRVQSEDSNVISDGISIISDSGVLLSRRIANLREKARESVAASEARGDQLHKTVMAINELSGYISNITELIGMINDVADQTNPPALKAAIKAARAGEAGKGFSAVADEVNKLADRATSPANDIKKIISGHLVNIIAMISFLKETEGAFGNIRESITQIRSTIKDVYSFTEDLSGKNSEINDHVRRLASISADIYNS